MGVKSQNIKERLEVAGISTHPLMESQWVKSRLIVRKCESDEHKNWGFSPQVFRDHVATDGSLFWCRRQMVLRVDGQLCNWITMRRRG